MKSFHGFVFIMYFLIAFYLSLMWLPQGEIVGGGDVGIPVYLPQRAFNLAKNAWWETQASGTSIPLSFTAIPFYGILSMLDSIGVGVGIIQKAFIILVITGGAISIYLLSIEYLLSKWVSFLAGLFYIFNFTSLSVWHRGVHNAMLMLFLAPLTLLILSKGIKKEKYTYIIWINVVSFLGSYVFGALGYLFALWLLWIVFILMNLLSEFNNFKRRKFILTYFFILIVAWFSSNLWWAIHLISSGVSVIGDISEELQSRSSSVLTALRVYHQPQYILRGVNGFYHYETKEWGDFYTGSGMVLFSWIPSLIIFSTLLFKSNYKSFLWRFLLVLTTIVLFFSKGVNPPLGLFNKYFLEYFPIMAPIRNSYEKIGILLAIPYSLLFSLGCYQLSQHEIFKKKAYFKFFLIILIFITLVILVKPMWIGEIFHTQKGKYQFLVPGYYSDANKWFEQISDDTRILHLPLANGESTDYDWGYTGIEPSQLFFPGSSIGYLTGVSGVDSRLTDLIISIHKQETDKIIKALASFNVGWVVVHNETVWRPRQLESVDRINKWLRNDQQFLEYVQDIGPLSIWKVKDQYRSGHFYAIGQLVKVNRREDNKRLEIWNNLNDGKSGFIVGVSKGNNDLEPFIKSNVVVPIGRLGFQQIGLIDTGIALKEIATIKHLPGTLIYNFLSFWEKINSFLRQDDEIRDCYKIMGKRLAESVYLLRIGKTQASENFLTEYQIQTRKCSKIDKQTLNLYLSYPILKEEILGQLIRQRVVLENEFRNSTLSKKALEVQLELNEYMAKINFYPKYTPVFEKNGKDISIFTYDVNEDGKYLIKIKNPKGLDKQHPPVIKQIDNMPVNMIVEKNSDGELIYTGINFTKGYHEIYLESESENLIEEQIKEYVNKTDSGFKIELDPNTKEEVFIGQASTIPINLSFEMPVDVEEKYIISFDFYLPFSNTAEFIIFHDSDQLDSSGSVKPSISNMLTSDGTASWRRVEFPYSPAINSNNSTILFKLQNSNLSGNTGEFLIKNIKVSKMLANDLFLEKSNPNTKNLGRVEFIWKKISPTNYELEISNQNTPYLLNFSETFHNKWEITDEEGNRIILPHIVTNGFANGWLIERALPDKVFITFGLQNTLKIGVLLSLGSFIVFSGVIIFLDYQNRKRN